jgi:hypothetical protein
VDGRGISKVTIWTAAAFAVPNNVEFKEKSLLQLKQPCGILPPVVSSTYLSERLSMAPVGGGGRPKHGKTEEAR